jgi:hypothetical protein
MILPCPLLRKKATDLGSMHLYREAEAKRPIWLFQEWIHNDGIRKNPLHSRARDVDKFRTILGSTMLIVPLISSPSALLL